MWLALFRQYWGVSMFRQSPENTPYSPLLSGIVALAFLALIVLQWMMTDVSQQLTFATALLIAGSLVLSYVVYTWVLLLLYRLKARFVQTLTCLLAGHTVVHLVAFPLLLVMPVLLNAQTIPVLASLFGIVYLVLTLVLAIWQFMVSAYIYKYALSVNWLSAVLAGFGLLACNILTVSFW